jgi:hypothetical protein
MVPQKEIGRKTHAAGFADGDEGSRSFSGRLFDMAKKMTGDRRRNWDSPSKIVVPNFMDLRENSTRFVDIR